VRTQVGILATVWQVHARNLPSIVDIEWFCARYVQVDDQPLVPQYGSYSAEVAGERLPNDLTLGVDRPRLTKAVTVQSSKISYRPVFPVSGKEQGVSLGCSNADCFAGIIQPVCNRETSSERS